MKISEINYVSPSFGAIVPEAENTVKQAVQTNVKRCKRLEKPILAAITALTTGCVSVDADNVLQGFGIKSCKEFGQKINIYSGYNGGFYSVDTGMNLDQLNVKQLVAHALELNSVSFGGLINYIDMIKHIKRQDIIQNGLKQYDYALNAFVSDERKQFAATALSEFTEMDIKPEQLFFIAEEAFYYDMFEKTAYSVNYMPNTIIKARPTFRVCKFETDKRGNAIGYKMEAPDLYQQKVIEYKFKEQQAPSDILPSVADVKNNKLFAESFRFGNVKPSDAIVKFRYPKVLEHLSQKVGVKNPDNEMLQFVKMYNKDKEVVSRICYYDPTTGRSLVYDDRGKYMYQLEYNKNAFGNIIACTKF